MRIDILILVAFLVAALPLGADSSPANVLVPTLVAELLPKASESGFAELAILKARSLGKLADSASLISSLITPNTRASDRSALYVELASIQELLGRYEDAANSWEAASAVLPGQGELTWLLSAAACRLAIGDTEAALALSRATLLTTSKPGLVALAKLIEARTLMLAGDLAGSLARSKDVIALGVTGFEAAALSLARDVTNGAEREAYEKLLREKYSGRPEAQDALASIYYSLVNIGPVQIQTALQASATKVATVSIPAEDPQAEGRAAAVSGPLYYQLGAFRDEANAALLSSRLVRAGFKPKTVRRESRAGVLFIVYLEAGPDPARSMIALKDAGFESWPLFAEP